MVILIEIAMTEYDVNLIEKNEERCALNKVGQILYFTVIRRAKLIV